MYFIEIGIKLNSKQLELFRELEFNDGNWFLSVSDLENMDNRLINKLLKEELISAEFDRDDQIGYTVTRLGREVYNQPTDFTKSDVISIIKKYREHTWKEGSSMQAMDIFIHKHIK